MKYRFLVVILVSLVICPVLSAQKEAKKFFVTGVVKDADNNPVEGALILIDKKYTNKSTDNKGFFKVKVRQNAEMIAIKT